MKIFSHRLPRTLIILYFIPRDWMIGFAFSLSSAYLVISIIPTLKLYIDFRPELNRYS